MKILSLHIQNFGKLNNFDYSFNPQKNVIIAENGFGKTTLAVFIKCMFYGIKGGNKASLNDENERLKYQTWGSTALIGGTLDFEYQDKKYRIERYFGDKPSLDTFKLIDLKTNKQTKDFSENLGEELFGVDANSFERSTYLPQKNIDKSNTLSSKLASLTFGTEDTNSIDKVIANLEASSKKYFKSNGRAGLISETKDKITDLEIKIEECVTFENNANLIQTEIDEIDLKISQINNELEELKPKLEVAISSSIYLEEYQKLMQNVETTKERYLELKDMFQGKNINEKMLDDLILLSQEFLKINSKIEMLKNADDSELKSYTTKFNGYTPNIQEIDNNIMLYDKNVKENNNNTIKSDKGVYCILFIILGALAFLGSIFCYKFNIVVGVILSILSIALVSYFVYKLIIINKSKNKENYTVDNVSIIQFLNKYGYNTDNISQSLLNIKSDAMIYLKLLKNKEIETNQLNQLCANKQKIEDAILPFLNNFYDAINDDYFTLISAVKTNYLEYLGLDIKLKEMSKSIKEYDSKIDKTINLQELKLQEEKLNTGLNLYVTEKEKLLNQKINSQNKANLKQEYIQSLSIEKENFKNYFSKYNTILSTINFLKQAKDNLCSKYLQPITSAFLNHLKEIDSVQIKDVSVDTDLNVNVIDNTKTRDLEYFSKGYKDLINICLRLSLIDTMFVKTKPCIILDDPFINLDDKKVASAINVLDKLSQNYQILYLTCNSSRS